MSTFLAALPAQEIPSVAQPLEACCYCWYTLHPEKSYPEDQSSTICSQHIAWIEQQSAERQARRAAEAWQRCLEHYLAGLRELGLSRTVVTNHQNILAQFLQGRNPEVITRQDVEAYCRADSYHGKRAAIRGLFDHAIACDLLAALGVV